MREKEHIEAVALMRWTRINTSRQPALRWLFHIPNGGARNKAVAGKLKAEGVMAGVSDYLLPIPRMTLPDTDGLMTVKHGLFLELKARGNTYPTPGQYEFLDGMIEQGYAATWCRGWSLASEAITAYLAGSKIPKDWREFEG